MAALHARGIAHPREGLCMTRDQRDQRRNLRSDLWRETVAEEVGAEFDFHVEMRARELIARGHTAEDAKRIAVARFGDIREVRAVCEDIGGRRERDMKRTTYWSELAMDIRYAFRQIRSTPAFTALVVGTLALGIAATTTIFSAVNAVVLRPLGYPDPDRVLFVNEVWQEQEGSASIGNFLDWRAQTTAFEQIGAINWTAFNLAGDDEPEQVNGGRASYDYFSVFRTQPALGRLFTADDDRPGAPRVVLLSHGLWMRRYAGDAAIVGKSMQIDGEPATIIGVMPPTFDPMLNGEQLWVPAAYLPERIEKRDEHYITVVARLKAGVTQAAAQQQLNAIAKTAQERFPQANAGRTVKLSAVQDILIGETLRQRLFLLLAAVGVVMLIACANVANLLLARGAARQKELAVRGALGAGRARIMRQLLTENLLLAMITVVVSVAIAGGLIRVIVGFAPAAIPRIAETRIDARVLLFALVTGTISSFVFGLAPALRAARVDLQETLRTGGRDARGMIRDWLRNALVVAEVALSVLLLIGAGLLIRSAIEAGRVDPGYRTTGVVTGQVSLPGARYGTPAQVASAFQRISDNLSQQPGVTHAAVASQAPLGPGGNSNGIVPEGAPMDAAHAVDSRLHIVSSGYFSALGIDIAQGRDFNAGDVRGAARATIISKALAETLFPGENPIGKRVVCCEGSHEDPMWKTVVGVTGDLKSRGPTTDVRPEFYLPLAQAPDAAWDWLNNSMSVVAAGEAPAAQLIDAARAAVLSVDAQVPLSGVTTLEDALRLTMAPARFNTLLLTILGFLGMALAAIGIYGVVSYFVNLRTQEIGVRIALGASAGSVIRLMTRQALLPVCGGLLFGVAGALAATRVLQQSLYNVVPTDPVTFASVVAALLVVAAVAIVIPARRATRVPPTQAFRG